LALLIPFVFANDNKKMLLQRKEQLLSDYPDLITKINLLINTGLTINSSLRRIVNDYEHSPFSCNRYLYKELKICISQIDNGISEATAYFYLGRRIGLPCYIKFCSLLEQNLKKGTKELRLLLSSEVTFANEEKRRNIKKKYEKASTKLIFPMMLIFLSILILIMIPAFFNISFN
jgi:tight adherence protein C